MTLSARSASLIGGALLALAAPFAVPLSAKIIGTNPAAEPVTPARIAALPDAQRSVWSAYLARSTAAMAADKAALAAERIPGSPIPAPAAGGNGADTMPLDRDAAWYAGPEARRIADIIVSFQTPAGGWGKNHPRNVAPRQRGQAYVAGDPNATPGTESWAYVGTIDNDATITEIRFLSRVAAAGGAAAAPYRDAMLRGIAYLLGAQYPNGGWPQVWPLQGGYHDAITLNDNAMAQVLGLMTEIGEGRGDFAGVPAAVRSQAKAAAARGIACILAMQVVVDGRPVGWGQQHDAITLRITSARNYEPPVLAAPETASVLRYLMRVERTPAVTRAIEGGIAWLRATMIAGKDWRDPGDGGGKRLIGDPAAAPLWARFYTVDGNIPVFGDRDKTIHDDVMELSTGRRRGYAWYGTAPGSALKAYAGWRKAG